MTDISKLGMRVEKTTDGYRLTDHVGNVYLAQPLSDGKTFVPTLVKAGRHPGFNRHDRLTEKNGVLCLVGR